MNRSFRRGMSVAIVGSGVLLMGAISHGARERGGIRGFTSNRIAEQEVLEQKFRAIPDPGHAEADLRHLTSEPHLAGTEGSRRVAEWLKAQYQSYGFDAQIVSYSVWLAQ